LYSLFETAFNGRKAGYRHTLADQLQAEQQQHFFARQLQLPLPTSCQILKRVDSWRIAAMQLQQQAGEQQQHQQQAACSTGTCSTCVRL
jgi:hypothetical protein